MDHVILDFEIYLHYKKRLPGYKRFLESEIKTHDEVLSVIDEGNLEYKKKSICSSNSCASGRTHASLL